MPVALIGVTNKKVFDLGVNGPDDIRTLVIATGVAEFAFQGVGSDFERDSVVIPIGVFISDPSTFRGAAAIASLAAIANDGVSNNAGWAVDSVETPDLPPPGEYKITANLAVRDTDGFLLRISYQVNLLFTTSPIPHEPPSPFDS
jgi:hypothetical protein